MTVVLGQYSDALSLKENSHTSPRCGFYSHPSTRLTSAAHLLKINISNLDWNGISVKFGDAKLKI